MGVFQPLFYSGGRYSSANDRKLLSSLLAAEVSGARVSGVIPAGISANSMLVTASSSNTISVATGMCVIHDVAIPTGNSGVYLAGIEGSAETATFSTNSSGSPRTDKVYAVVDHTPYYITKKEITGGNTATLTTSESHGFKAGQKVVVVGVDEFFDGTYAITAVTDNTFSYAKTGTNRSISVFAEVVYGTVSYSIRKVDIAENGTATLKLNTTPSAIPVGARIRVSGINTTLDGTQIVSAVTTSPTYTVSFKVNKYFTAVTGTEAAVGVDGLSHNSAIARVPFFIGIEEGSNTIYNSKSKIKLAEYQVLSGSNIASNIVDTRTFVTAAGGVHLYNSATGGTTPAAAPGKFRFNLSTNLLEYYTTKWESFLTIGTDGSTAAAGNHTHDGVYATTSHTHSSRYASSSHTHAWDPNWPAVPGGDVVISTYKPLPLPKSLGSTGSFSINSTSFQQLSGLSFTYSVGDYPIYAMLQWSSYINSDSNIFAYMSVDILNGAGSATVISPSPSVGSSSHQTNATDGTAFNVGDMVARYNNYGPGVTYGSRLLYLSANTSYMFKPVARTLNGAATFNFPTVRLIPVQMIYPR